MKKEKSIFIYCDPDRDGPITQICLTLNCFKYKSIYLSDVFVAHLYVKLNLQSCNVLVFLGQGKEM